MPALNNRFRWLSLQSIATLGLAACAVGPDFHTPKAPDVKGYTSTSLPSTTAPVKGNDLVDKPQTYVDGLDIPGEWWALYHSPALDRMIKQGIANSPNLAAAKATLIEAKENYRAQIGTSYAPSITANGSAQREQGNEASSGGSATGSPFNLYNSSVSVSYILDVFGGQRRTVEASKAQVDYERYELAAAYLSLTANIVTTAITAASYQAQISATQALIKAEAEDLVITQKQMKLGGASGANVLTQANTLAQNRALLPPLQNSLNQTLNALAVLLGVMPANLPPLDINLDSLTLPADLPVSLPSKLVEQRPDILASSAQLHTASANVGIATANLLPQITLTGSYGAEANHTNTLFSGNSTVWAFGGQLMQPVFNGGALRAQRRSAIAAYQVAAAQYQQTVLQAFQNVADSLQALQTDALSLSAQQQAESTAKDTLAMTQKQYRLGGASYLNVLTAQVQYQQARVNYIQAAATRYSDTAALFQSLGGGWWKQNLEKTEPQS